MYKRQDIDGAIVDQTPPLAGDGDWGKSVYVQDAALIAKIRADSAQPEAVQDARQLLNLQKVIDACYESARSGREVAL